MFPLRLFIAAAALSSPFSPAFAEASRHELALRNPTPYPLEGQLFIGNLEALFPDRNWRELTVTGVQRKDGSALPFVQAPGAGSLPAELIVEAAAAPFSSETLVVEVRPKSPNASPAAQPATGPAASGVSYSVNERGDITAIRWEEGPEVPWINRVIIPQAPKLVSSQTIQGGQLAVRDFTWEIEPEVTVSRRIYSSPQRLQVFDLLHNESAEGLKGSHFRVLWHPSLLKVDPASWSLNCGYLEGFAELTDAPRAIRDGKPDAILPESAYAVGLYHRESDTGYALTQENSDHTAISYALSLRGSGEMIGILGPYRSLPGERRWRMTTLSRYQGGLEGFRKAAGEARNYYGSGVPRIERGDAAASSPVAAAMLRALEEAPLPAEGKARLTEATALLESDGFAAAARALQAAGVEESLEWLRTRPMNRKGLTPQQEVSAAMEKVYRNAAFWDWQMGHFEQSRSRTEAANRLAEAVSKPATISESLASRSGPPETGWRPFVTIVRELGHDVVPFGMIDHIRQSGFTHIQVHANWGTGGLLPRGYGQDVKDADALGDASLLADQLVKHNLNAIVRVGPCWPPVYLESKYANGKMVNDNEEFIPPSILGEETELTRLWHEQHIAPLIHLFEKKGVNVSSWDYGAEPQLYGGRAMFEDPLMIAAFRNWLRQRYQEIGALNAVWKTTFESFDKVAPPQHSPAPGWHDLVIFENELLAEGLRYGAEKMRTAGIADTPIVATFCSNVMGPGNVNAHFGFDPWISARSNLGEVTGSDVYYRSGLIRDMLRVYELYCGGGMRPVESLETNNYIISPEPKTRGAYRIDDPDKLRMIVWTGAMFGLRGTALWSWSGTDSRWDMLNADATLSEEVLRASLVAQEVRVWSGLLKELKPVTPVALYYPRASFIKGSAAEAAAYEGLFLSLHHHGFQCRLFSNLDAEEVLREQTVVVIPQAPYLEGEMPDRLVAFMERGGRVIYTGDLPKSDEYGRPLPPEKLEQLFTTAKASGALQSFGERVGVGFLEGTNTGWLDGEWKFRFGNRWAVRVPSEQAVKEADATPDKGMEEAWYRPETVDADWAKIRVGSSWTHQGHDTSGWGWYRKAFTPPAALKGKRFQLFGDTLKERGWVYLNGELIKATQSYNEVFTVDITDNIKWGEPNVIAVRVRNSDFGGGICGDFKITSPELERADWVWMGAALRKAGATPVSRSGTLMRSIMKDDAGNRYLLIANESDQPLTTEVELPSAHGEAPAASAESLLTHELLPLHSEGDAPLLKVTLPRYGFGFYALKPAPLSHAPQP